MVRAIMSGGYLLNECDQRATYCLEEVQPIESRPLGINLVMRSGISGQEMLRPPC